MAGADITDHTKSLREEVQHLFGLRWDSFVEWTMIAWLSLWFWTSCLVTSEFTLPSVGPIEWIAEVLRALAVDPPEWLLAIPGWLTDPQRAWLLHVFVISAVAAATLAVRSYRHTGLRVLALACAALAYEVDASASPIAQILLLAAVPAAVAILISFLPDRREREDRMTSFFHGAGVSERYIMRVFGLFVAPVVAPFLLLVALVTSYRTEVAYQPSYDLARAAASGLESAGGSTKLADADALAVVSAIVAAITANSTQLESRWTASTFNYEWKERRAAEAARRRAQRWRQRGFEGGSILP